jgi:hypothetical protein
MDEERATTLFYYGITDARCPHALSLPGSCWCASNGSRVENRYNAGSFAGLAQECGGFCLPRQVGGTYRQRSDAFPRDGYLRNLCGGRSRGVPLTRLTEAIAKETRRSKNQCPSRLTVSSRNLSQQSRNNNHLWPVSGLYQRKRSQSSSNLTRIKGRNTGCSRQRPTSQVWHQPLHPPPRHQRCRPRNPSHRPIRRR